MGTGAEGRGVDAVVNNVDAIYDRISTISASEAPARTTSPSFLPVRARATGDTYEIVPRDGSASSSPTMRYVCRRPSSRRMVTVQPNCTSAGLDGGAITCAVV